MALRSTATLTDGSGNVLTNFRYGVFGDLRYKYGGSGTQWLFAGEQRDSESGLDFLRARYYDPATGRFVSQDPLGGGYPYAGNNPVNRVDPTGLYYIGGWSDEWGGVIEFDSTDVGLSPCDIYGHCYIWSTSGTIELDPLGLRARTPGQR